MAKSVDVERKSSTYSDEKVNVNEKAESVNSIPGEVYADVRDIDLDEDGKERPIGMLHGFIGNLYSLTANLVTDIDVATRLISLDDDPTLPVFTFRMWFLGIGLSCFGSVLGQIFVSTFSLSA